VVDHAGQIGLDASGGLNAHPGGNPLCPGMDDILDAFLVVDDAKAVAAQPVFTAGVSRGFLGQDGINETLNFVLMHQVFRELHKTTEPRINIQLSEKETNNASSEQEHLFGIWV
jgi:hypothetical protein